MSNRPGRSNRISGPQSALTDFLAANNISARQIRDTYEQRDQVARQQNAQTAEQEQDEVEEEEAEAEQQEVPDSEEEEDEDTQLSQSARKRKREAEKAKAKMMANKKQKKRGKKKPGSDDDDDDEDWEQAGFGKNMYKKAVPKPGQFENCEICDKRFTVTAYSKTGPEGGLVCSPCGRDLTKNDLSKEKKVKKPAPGKNRRKVESNRLDGIVKLGSKSLQQLCIEKVADNHLDIEEFGDLPDTVLQRLSEIFSKRRVIDPRTFRLFLRPDLDTIAVHDCANIEANDYMQMFAIIPNVQKVILRNACQFKDSVVEYMMDKAKNISHLQLYGANLISSQQWISFFTEQGSKLEVLKLSWLDAFFTDEVVYSMVTKCPNLRRLKIKYCKQLTSASLSLLGHLEHLEHLSLHMSQPVEAEVIKELVLSVGDKLKTLSLESFRETDDSVIAAIATTCSNLSKLRLTDLDCVTDAALVSLFTPGSDGTEGTVVPPLAFLDISSARDVDNNNPAGPEDAPIGFASRAFRTFMAHSGTTVKRLHFPSCRHITYAMFWEVFIGDSEKTDGKPGARANEGEQEEMEVDAKDEQPSKPQLPWKYSELEELNVSFCNDANTEIIKGVFRSCPSLKKLIAFGCFRIEDLSVPKGVAVIGLPRAHDPIEKLGDGVDNIFDMLTSMSVLPAAPAVQVGA